MRSWPVIMIPSGCKRRLTTLPRDHVYWAHTHVVIDFVHSVAVVLGLAITPLFPIHVWGAHCTPKFLDSHATTWSKCQQTDAKFLAPVELRFLQHHQFFVVTGLCRNHCWALYLTTRYTSWQTSSQYSMDEPNHSWLCLDLWIEVDCGVCVCDYPFTGCCATGRMW